MVLREYYLYAESHKSFNFRTESICNSHYAVYGSPYSQ